VPAWLLLALSLTLGIPVAWTIIKGRERERRDRARDFDRELANELLQQASGLDRLVAVLGGLADSLDGERVLEQACADAKRLVSSDESVLLEARDGTLLIVAASNGIPAELAALQIERPDDAARAVAAALGHPVAHATPLAGHNELIGVLVVTRAAGDDAERRWFSPAELAQLRVLADFAARAAQNARLYAHLERLRTDAEQRERERARLSDQLAHAEQAERRRLAMLLHDGPQQTIAGVALTLDACLDVLADADLDEARRLLSIARDRNRESVRDLRELGWSLEPIALREQGLAAALAPLTSRLSEAHGVAFEVALAGAETLDAGQRTFVYQIVREAISNAIKHARPRTISVSCDTGEVGAITVSVTDDGAGMKRLRAADGLSQGTDAMRERAAALGATIEWRPVPGGGTSVRLTVPGRQKPRLAA
jgi:signal transduction histidine kinase